MTRLITNILGFTLAFTVGCAAPGSSPEQNDTVSACADNNCPVGQECGGGGCVTVRPTLYPHIQLASALFRGYNDSAEITWRAQHNDLIIGLLRPDQMRQDNPNIRLFEYFMNMHYTRQTEGADWAVAHGYDPEDFYLHYRQDMYFAAYGGQTLVPGFGPGVIPGWNPNMQSGDPPASATDRSQSRAVTGYGPAAAPWYLANLANAGYRRFLAERVRRTLAGEFAGGFASGIVEGCMADHAIYYPVFNEGQIDKTNEYYNILLDDNHPYCIAYEEFYRVLKQELADNLSPTADIMPNYGHVSFLSRPDRFSQNVQQIVDWAWGEVWMSYRGADSPLFGGARVIQYEKDYEKGIANIVRQSKAGNRRVLGARDLAGGLAGSDRGRLFTLALYYLVHNPNTFYMYESFNGHTESSDISTWQWNPAVEFDIGQPAENGTTDFDGNTGTTEHYILETGADPHDPLLTYNVLARDFTGGLVLAKMLPMGSVIDDRSETTHVLSQPYTILQADGSKGPTVTQITLRNNEGVILVTP